MPGWRRLTLVASSLDVGGTSRVMTTLANAWVEAKRDVEIVALDWPRDPFFPLDRRVEVHHLDMIQASKGPISAVRNNLRRVSAMRQAIEATDPDVVLAFGDRANVRTLIATIWQPWPIVVSERTAAQPYSGRAWHWLRRLTYPRADSVVFQTAAMARDVYPRLGERVSVIPNPVPDLPPDAADVATSRIDERRAVALGRLVPQKGYDTLLSAFAIVAARDREARLQIWGAGPEEQRLHEQIVRLGLADRVELAGQTDHPADALRSATVVVLTSRVEGFPNVLLEAMALGRPVVAVDCRYGPAEIVRDGIDGYLVPPGDTAALADAIASVLASPTLQMSMSERALEVRSRFALEPILASWDELIDSVIARRLSR
jgi:GalNAc-alpha-(1->4)-GalNAc-alpha-(1->3)-diNAcBac-PP-undecaprenol alpha-1,4-N-acetyl-D-galactosaminyltransferase